MRRGSAQQEAYLRARERGASVDEAAEAAGILPGEAALLEAAREAGEIPPPSPEPAPIGHNSKETIMSEGNVAADQLRLFIERAERVMEEIKGLKDDLKDVFLEAKGSGFDTKTMKSIIRLRGMTADARREEEALLDTYRAALGMLDGTPLGHWALERLKPKKPEQSENQEPGDAPGGGNTEDYEQVEATENEPSVDDARRLGAEAAGSGDPVTANPFPAFDERRAAWDEAWCAALGSDGMDIPDALKPTPKPKKASARETA